MLRFKYYLKAVLELLFFACAAAVIMHLVVDKESELREKSRAVQSSLDAAYSASVPSSYDLNAASEWELQNINGIGEVTAHAIVEYREEHGGFSSVDELLNVSGIGRATLKKISPFLYLNEEDQNADRTG